MTTWRDLTDSLTPEQAAYLENWERNPEIPHSADLFVIFGPMADGSAPPPETRRAGLLFAAKEFVESNAAAALYADVATPPDATFVDPWQRWGDSYARVFGGTQRVVEHWVINITGIQHCDGRAERSIRAYSNEQFNDGDMSAVQARQIAAGVAAAADELDRLGL